MKILVFEYVNGGGFTQDDLPLSFAHEGWLMLNAVLQELSHTEHELMVLLDERFEYELPDSVQRMTVSTNDDILELFSAAVEKCDAVLPIAPETEDILWTLCSTVERLGKLLLASSSDAVEQTSDKMKTFLMLSEHGIDTVPSHLLNQYPHFYEEEGTVIKARDGAGCENCFVCQNEDDFERLLSSVHQPKNYLVQPYISGMALSLSALFKEGKGYLLSVNRQYIEIHENQRLKLKYCDVNYPIDMDIAIFQHTINQLAQAFSGLWGYVGIDLIKRDERVMVVEINPRLTSSYVGIYDALGIQPVIQMLRLLEGEPDLTKTKNQTISIELEYNE